MVILENIDIDIDKAILQNIDIDKISNRFKFGISNRASSPSSLCKEELFLRGWKFIKIMKQCKLSRTQRVLNEALNLNCSKDTRLFDKRIINVFLESKVTVLRKMG